MNLHHGEDGEDFYMHGDPDYGGDLVYEDEEETRAKLEEARPRDTGAEPRDAGAE